MHRIALFAAAAALILTATADAAPRKKPRVNAERSATIAAKHARPRVARPAAVPLHQQWPTSWSDGSFSYRGN
jgi:hypothetical protein